MSLLAGPYWAAALLLAVAGAPKILRPHPTVRALRALWLPATPPLVRVLGAVEVGVGLAAVVLGGPLFALLVAASY
ncbi:MAG: hypothetical protein ACRDU8_01845, partial [Egibacteraceae bacterium]